MADDMLDLYRQASDWTLSKVSGAASQMDRATPCDDWDVRTLLNHMLDTQRYFTGAARGQDVALPSPMPPDLLGDDPVAAFAQSRSELLRAFGEPGAVDKSGPALGIALADQLLHGWDVAKATQGKSVDGLVSALVDAEKTEIQSAVTAGHLTQDQATQIESNLQQRVTDVVNGTRPAGGPGFGPRHGGFGGDDDGGGPGFFGGGAPGGGTPGGTTGGSTGTF